MKKLLGAFALALMGAILGVGATQYYTQDRFEGLEAKLDRAMERNRVVQTKYMTPMKTSTGANVVEVPNFIEASAQATPAVVHVKSFFERKGSSDPFGGLFGGDGFNQGQAAGSGVIISEDGFIATNNHVIEKADRIEVILEDKRSYAAEIIGRDPTTDLALLKVEESGLPYLPMGNSNDAVVGEWVLAVGNPFNLTSTVTAGIVSAKGRSLNLLDDEFAIESFIQTDAAVNPGNSGGALINTKGELVGINTAIASETGSYAGYSFAVPVNIVRKVMKDLREFGEVQRGIIGVQINNINAQFAEKRDIPTLYGAYVNGTIPGGAAREAGIKQGDVITRVDETAINSASELQEVIGTYRPGDRVMLGIIRDGDKMELPVVLRNREGTTSLGARRNESDGKVSEEPGIAADQELGARLEPISYRDKFNLGIDSGVKIARLTEGKLKDAGLEEGFIITRVNKKYVDSPEDVQNLMDLADGSILIEGLNAEGKRKFFAFDQ